MRAVISGVKVSGRVDVLEYADYYALGGVARSGGMMQYRYGYQGQYAERDKETEWNSFELRQYDAVIGRWLSPDPYGQYDSPYVAMGNDWTNQVDPDGGWSWAGAGIGAAVGFGAGSIYGLATGQDNWLQYGLAGAAGGFVGGGLSGNTTRADNNPGGAFSAGGGSHGMTLSASTSTSFSLASMASAANGLGRGLTGLQQPKPKVIDDTRQAFNHYFNGNGAAVNIGPNTVRAVLTHDMFLQKHDRIIQGKTKLLKGNFPVNMRTKVFHIGKTVVEYSIKCSSEYCLVIYNLFVRDGFWDPDFIDELQGKAGIKQYKLDGMGPNLERFGGKPYKYNAAEIIYSFPNPGY